VQLVVQLVDLRPGFLQYLPARASNPVNPPPAPRNFAEYGFQQARALQPVKQRVQRPRADAIAVMLELLHHPQPEDRLVGGVQQHVDANETVKKRSPLIPHRINILLHR
jgi:hypothetical protein